MLTAGRILLEKKLFDDSKVFTQKFQVKINIP